MAGTVNRWKRYADWDERPLRLDKFAAEDPANGFSAFSSPKDPKPGIGIENGRVISMDGVLDISFLESRKVTVCLLVCSFILFLLSFLFVSGVLSLDVGADSISSLGTSADWRNRTGIFIRDFLDCAFASMVGAVVMIDGGLS